MRAERHGTPALESGSAWTHVDLDANLRNLPGQVCHFTVLRIDLDDRLITEIGRVNELAIGSIELPEDAQLAHLEEGLASADIDQDVLEDFIHILRFAWKVLEIPLDFSSIRIECEC